MADNATTPRADAAPDTTAALPKPAAPSGPAPFQGSRSRKTLASAIEATRYQREWFADVRRRVAEGEPFALVSADAPQEIFRAMDIPYVVNQWWASVVSAKQRSAHNMSLLRARGLPDDSEQYSALALGSVLDDPDDPDAPWGGLPRPTIVLGEAGRDAHRKVFDVWGEQPGIHTYRLETAVTPSVRPDWWELMPDRWEEAIGSARLDLMVDELEGLVRFLEVTTGRTLRESRLREVMELVNEQEEYNRRARDLIAATTPAPLSITDSIPSVMIPQWHRGTAWGRDAARRFHDEVAERVTTGAAACPGERMRLMWVGTGLWFNMGLYQHFQDRFGAVFVWSMYLGIAADGYIRHGDDPMRTLAARFSAFADQLHTPPWSCEWYVKEARHNQIDGVVHLVSSSAPHGYFTTRALEAAGVPVLEIHADNADARGWDDAAFTAAIEEFLERRVEPGAAARRAAG
ncbi:MAG: 2-hydroxyacyl-CoA dehydratase [Streptomycetaceae bacterium]|jgi:hypothetical protein|nr:2-hydroxyacyl-CoA dehydratase [Streptomycetaceae bacterium]